MNTVAPNIYLLIVAFLSLFIGLGIFSIISRRGFAGNALSASLICWVFIALFPVFMIFSFFPDKSSVDGSILGFSMGGAFAAFIFIWWFGARKYIDAVKKDELNRKILELEGQLTNARIINKPNRELLPDGRTYI